MSSVAEDCLLRELSFHKKFPFNNVLVAGLGVSGIGAVEVLKSVGATAITADERKEEAQVHDFSKIDWDNIDAVVTSPVFNPRTPFILEAQKRNIPVISEVELAWLVRVNSDKTNNPAPWVGITGTNGKTSTTEMTSEMLTACGFDAPAVGNIGKSVSHAAMESEHDVLCVELSSFQLHFTNSMRLDCAAITNIAADHLDWHGGIEAYAKDKSKVFNGVKKALVYNAQDSRVSELAANAQVEDGCKKIGFTLEPPESGEIGVENGWIVDKSGVAGGKVGDPVKLVELRDLKHLCEPDGSVYPHLLANAQDSRVSELAANAQVEDGCKKIGFTLEPPESGEIGVENGWIVDKSGVAGGKVGDPVKLVELRDLKHLCEPDGSVYPHLLADALTALALTLGLNPDVENAVKTLCNFAPGGHRIQTVATLNADDNLSEHSIRFVDDSKATNAHAAAASISSFGKKNL